MGSGGQAGQDQKNPTEQSVQNKHETEQDGTEQNKPEQNNIKLYFIERMSL
jgi:hypothetical protein